VREIDDDGASIAPTKPPELVDAGSAPADDCLPGDALLRDSFVAHSQVDIEQLSGIRHITGDLRIQALFEDVPSLEPLRCLENVDGTLDITATMLDSLEGLRQLVRVGTLTLAFNGGLRGLAGLRRLQRVDGAISLDSNPKLDSFSGLDSLEEVGSLVVHNNPVLSSLAGWPVAANIRDSVNLEANVALRELGDFSGVHNLAELELRGNALIDSLRAFRNLETVAGSLVIANQPALADLSGLENLIVAGSLVIDFNENLTKLSGIERLSHVDADLSLTGNARLADISGLSKLRGVGGELRVYSNRALRSCDAEALASRLGVVCAADPPIECRGRCTCTGSIDPSTCESR
jgi:hypothetical protein